MELSLEERIRSATEELSFDAKEAGLLAQAQLALHGACLVNTPPERKANVPELVLRHA